MSEHVEQTISEVTARIGQLQDLLTGLHKFRAYGQETRLVPVLGLANKPHGERDIQTSGRNPVAGPENVMEAIHEFAKPKPKQWHTQIKRAKQAGNRRAAVPSNGFASRRPEVLAAVQVILADRRNRQMDETICAQELSRNTGLKETAARTVLMAWQRLGWVKKTSKGHYAITPKFPPQTASAHKAIREPVTPKAQALVRDDARKEKLQDALEEAMVERDRHQAGGRDALVAVEQKKIDGLVAQIQGLQ